MTIIINSIGRRPASRRSRGNEITQSRNFFFFFFANAGFAERSLSNFGLPA
jgi:hypothetical protein